MGNLPFFWNLICHKLSHNEIQMLRFGPLELHQINVNYYGRQEMSGHSPSVLNLCIQSVSLVSSIISISVSIISPVYPTHLYPTVGNLNVKFPCAFSFIMNQTEIPTYLSSKSEKMEEGFPIISNPGL